MFVKVWSVGVGSGFRFRLEAGSGLFKQEFIFNDFDTNPSICVQCDTIQDNGIHLIQCNAMYKICTIQHNKLTNECNASSIIEYIQYTI